MTWESEFEDLMPHEVTRRPAGAPGEYGKATHGDPAQVRCRVVYKTRLVATAGRGESADALREVVSPCQVTCAGSDTGAWTVRDEITLPDGAKPKILAVHTLADEDGTHHQKVFC